jgi:hypothetical protein
MSENKTSKYFKYAIGEILLVVIGILIALQINNWNQAKQNDRRACNYLSNLTADLKDQLLNIENQFLFEVEVTEHGEALLNNYRQNSGFLVDEPFSKQLSILNNRLTFKVANATFEELLASGNTNLFKNPELKKSLLSYFKDIERDKQVITQNNKYIDNHFAPMALEISTHYMPNLQISGFKDLIDKGYLEKGNNAPLIDKEKAFGIINKKLQSEDYELKLLNEITYRYRIAAVHMAIVDELKTKTNMLLKVIEAQQNNCSYYD